MSISITDLRTKVRDMSGFVDNNVVTDDQLDDILNECYFNIASKADWPWLEISQSTTFAAGQDSFTFSNSSYLDLSRVVEAKVLVNCRHRKFGRINCSTFKCWVDISTGK